MPPWNDWGMRSEALNSLRFGLPASQRYQELMQASRIPCFIAPSPCLEADLDQIEKTEERDGMMYSDKYLRLLMLVPVAGSSLRTYSSTASRDTCHGTCTTQHRDSKRPD
jgi:hypothetical protein